MDNPIPYIQLFIIIQSVLFLIYLSLERRLSSLANRLLGCLMLVLCLQMTMNLFGQGRHLPIASDLAVAFGMLYGPLLYFYSRSLSYHKFSLVWRDSWHLMPAVIILALSLFTDISSYYFALGIFLSLICYTVMTWLHLQQYRFILSQTRSGYDQIALNWLSNLLLLQVGLLLINIFSVVMYAYGFELAGMVAEVVLFCGLWLLVSMMIFQGMQHPVMFSGVTEEDRLVASASTTRSALTDAEIVEIMQKIENHLTTNKTYLNPGLTVTALGRQLVIVPKLISQAINQHTTRNFSDYINGYRIKHACDLLSAENAGSLSIMDVMLESGFITKSNFNRAFKSHTGMTPNQYRKSTRL